MNKDQTSGLKEQYRRVQKLMEIARSKPWLASYLLRRLREIKQEMMARLEQACLLMGLHRPRQVRKWLKRTAMPLVAGGSLVLMLNVGAVQAAGITVSQTNDLIMDGDGCSLREAIINANNDDQSGSTDCVKGDGADVITLPNGTILITGIGIPTENLSLDGDFDISTPITINGLGMNQSIIDGDGINRVFHVLPGGSLTLTDLTVQNGFVIDDIGGGILNEDGDLTLTNVLVTGNGAVSIGGPPPVRALSQERSLALSRQGDSAKKGRSAQTPQSDVPSSSITVLASGEADTQAKAKLMAVFPGQGGGIFNHGATGTARLTMTNSMVSGNYALYSGGGILNYAYGGQTEVTITSSSVISGNASAAMGGVGSLSVVGGQTTLTISDSTIQNNTTFSPDGGGGGIHNLAAAGGQSQLQLTNSTVSGNNSGGNGGGVTSYATNFAAVTGEISNSTISGNTAAYYSGGLNNNTGEYSTNVMTVTNTTISQNRATNGSGGGMTNFAGPLSTLNATISNSTISGNTATYYGGGVYNGSYVSPSTSVSISNSVISDNNATYGGGIYSFFVYSSTNTTINNSTISGNTATEWGGGLSDFSIDSNAALTINNSTVSGNSAALDGGGFYLDTSNAGPYTVTNTINHSTITNNTADSDNNGTGNGGGIYTYRATVDLSNSIVAGNFDTPNNTGTGNIHPDSHNLVNGNATNLVGNTTGITGTLGTGSDLINSNPSLNALADNGGTATSSGLPPFTHALTESSPAIDAADSTVCTAAPINSLDQRGEARPGAGTSACDIGAYEYQDLSPKIFYLPVLHKDFIAATDLVVDSVVANSSTVNVTIRNTGTTTLIDPFWVDVYFNPTSVPGINQPWDTIAPAGAAWGVTKSLAPGESLTLTVGDTYYDAGNSSTSFPSGATVYAFVDSINHSTAYGNVNESDESNNLGGPVTSTGSSTGLPTVSDMGTDSESGLPERN